MSCPDWPVTVAGRAGPVAVVERHLVVAASSDARANGVRPGQRRREAEAHCPALVVLSRDEGGELRAFEGVVRGLESLGVLVTVRQPGWASLATRGPARRLGGEAALARVVAALLEAAAPANLLVGLSDEPAPPGNGEWSSPERVGQWWRIGIADGPFTATLAARVGALVPPGDGPSFLAPFGVELLGRPELADLLRRLGLATLGSFAALDEGEVSARFGADGARAHRLARGLGQEAVSPRRPPLELAVGQELEPPAERQEAVVLLARALAEALGERLATAGLTCTLLRVEVVTEVGERLERCWADEEGWSPSLLAERLRWQLEAWLPAPAVGEEDLAGAGIAHLGLVPLEVIPARGRQLELWGRPRAGEEQVARAVARVQGMLGADQVLRPVPEGGRGPAEQVRLVPFGDPFQPGSRDAPWPGRLPAPSPAVVPMVPHPALLVDASGEPVRVNGRGEASAEPARLVIGDGPELSLCAWSAPWPCEERWWDRSGRRRRVRLQVLTSAGEGFLMVLEQGSWAVEGRYD
ncbi:MAG: hypothetical protein JWM85_1621 [Acidimicrobiaceae bacterium]|nr:hypothetical protein [Acidimicrobiaceae bacterium]